MESSSDTLEESSSDPTELSSDQTDLSSDQTDINSESSSSNCVVWLETSTNKVDLGKIDLSQVPELPGLTAKLEQAKALAEQLKVYADAGIKTEEDVRNVTVVATSLKSLQGELARTTLTVTDPTNLPYPYPTFTVTLRSDPSGCSGEISVEKTENIRHRPGNAENNIGGISPTSGTTDFSGTFSPNGNYGTVYFRGAAHGHNSGLVSVTITGDCKEQAQARLDTELAKLTAAGLMASALYSLLSGALTALLSSLLIYSLRLALGVVLAGGAYALAVLLLSAIAALAVYLWLASEVEKAKTTMRTKCKPYIDSLPPCE